MEKQGTHEYQVLVTRCKQTLHQSSHCGKLNLAGNAWYLMRIWTETVTDVKLFCPFNYKAELF